MNSLMLVVGTVPVRFCFRLEWISSKIASSSENDVERCELQASFGVVINVGTILKNTHEKKLWVCFGAGGWHLQCLVRTPQNPLKNRINYQSTPERTDLFDPFVSYMCLCPGRVQPKESYSPREGASSECPLSGLPAPLGQSGKAHQTRQAVDDGRITIEDFQGNQEANVVANLGAAAHETHEPTAEYLRWEVVAQGVRLFWLLVGPKLRDRPEAWSRARLPAGRGSCGSRGFCRWSRALRPLVWLALAGESSCTTPLPDAWTVTGRRAWYVEGSTFRTSDA
eukprot:1205981-Amphidinium_carterae.1